MDADRRLFEFAGRHLGVVTLGQALECGLTVAQVKRRAQAGRLVRVHRAVYRLPGTDPGSPRLRALAASLAAGRDSFVSHPSAAALWDVLPAVEGPVHVTVPADRVVTVPGIVVHRVAVLRPHERARLDGIPVTAPARTLLDLAGFASDADLEASLDTALVRNLVSLARLSTYLDDPILRNCMGIGRLRDLVRNRAFGVPESKLERAINRIYRRYRLPPGVRQLRAWVDGRAVRFDRAHPEERVGIEVDGRATHASRIDWQADLERNNATGISGWLVLRFTWWHVTECPDYVAFTIARALGLLPSRWRRGR